MISSLLRPILNGSTSWASAAKRTRDTWKYFIHLQAELSLFSLSFSLSLSLSKWIPAGSAWMPVREWFLEDQLHIGRLLWTHWKLIQKNRSPTSDRSKKFFFFLSKMRILFEAMFLMVLRHICYDTFSLGHGIFGSNLCDFFFPSSRARSPKDLA